MEDHLKISGARFAIVLALLVFDPVRCCMPKTVALAAEFPPAIIITEGKTAQGYPYLSGGVGSEERIAMEERGKAFNVKLVFAETSGPFLATVSVEILGAKNEPIVSLTTTGPWFYIQLPPGVYNVKATFAGRSKEARALRVGKDKRLQRTFVWDLGEDTEIAPEPQT
ncbi:MAG: hypothetical protein ACM3TN_05295 [Alphaproteobacteria bacterium]